MGSLLASENWGWRRIVVDSNTERGGTPTLKAEIDKVDWDNSSCPGGVVGHEVETHLVRDQAEEEGEDPGGRSRGRWRSRNREGWVKIWMIQHPIFYV